MSQTTTTADRKDLYHELLTYKVWRGLEALGVADKPAYRERAEFELGVIKETGFSAYFLIVGDLVQFMIKNKIRFVVRGSGCGSVCVWALKISHKWLDPVKMGLPFERFLNPHRVSNPDLDIDIDDTRRKEVFAYTVQKYGVSQVAKIGSFGTLKAKAAIQDVCRALNLPDYQLVAARISGLIPSAPGITLDKELARNEALRDEKANFPDVFAWAGRIEGKARQSGIHAAGTIIAPDIITKYTPTWISRAKDTTVVEDGVIPVTQWDMYDVEEAGLLKMDYLGLRTLRVIDQTVSLINIYNKRCGNGDVFDIDTIPQDCPRTWKMLGDGNLAGVFQVEKPFVRNFARRMNLEKTKDLWQLAVLVSIIRPGMMDTGATESYLRRTSGQEKVEPYIPKLGELGTLKGTYQKLVFQEDCMWVARDLAGFNMAEADTLRRAIAKKKEKDILKIKPQFIERAMTHSGIERGEAETVWEQMEAFARYGFNNAHAAAYGCVVAYQTAYLKANHPLFYMTCLINSEAGNSSVDQGYNFKLAEYVEEARSMGIKVTKPCLSQSLPMARVSVGDNQIIFGLDAIKGLSAGAAKWVSAKCRGVNTFQDFVLRCFETYGTGEGATCRRKGQEAPNGSELHKVRSHVNSRDLSALIWSGVLDVLMGGDPACRAMMSAAMEPLQDMAKHYHDASAKVLSGGSPRITPEQWKERINAFSFEEMEASVENVTLEEVIDKERLHTGCFLTYSPFEPFLGFAKQHDCVSFGDMEDLDEAVMLGMCRSVREVVCKKGKSKGRSMAFFSMAVVGGDVEVPAFPDTWDMVTRKVSSQRAEDGTPLNFLVEASKVYQIQLKRDQRGGWILNDLYRLSGASA